MQPVVRSNWKKLPHMLLNSRLQGPPFSHKLRARSTELLGPSKEQSAVTSHTMFGCKQQVGT